MPLGPEFSHDPDELVLGHRLVSPTGAQIGTVTDVLPDTESAESAWAVVRTGVMRSERFVPLGAAYLGTDGKVVVPYERATVKRAPRAADHVLTSAVRDELSAYYGT